MRKTRRSPRPSSRARRAVALTVERLEDRVLLDGANVFARLNGLVPAAGQVQQIPIVLSRSDFTLAGSQGVLGFQVKAAPGSSLDPAAVKVATAAGAAVAPTYVNADLAGFTQSLTLASLPYGSYTLTVGGDRGTTGAFQLNVFLAGDANGDHKIDLTDGSTIRSLQGAVAGDGRYTAEADSNLDGMISSFDYTEWRYNLNTATTLAPLALALSTPPGVVQFPSGALATAAAVVTLPGTTNPGASLALESGSDGLFDDGSTTADGSGNFSFVNVALANGVNTLQVMASDRFGQHQTAALAVTQDTQAPAITITSPASGLVSPTNVTVTGQVTDNLTGVASLEAALDGVALAPLSFDGAGNFSLTTSLPLDGTADGAHAVHLQATDRVGNVSPVSDLPFTLSTCSASGRFGDWTAGQTGGSATGRGTVDVPFCGATLHEGDSFAVTLRHPFVVPDQPSVLTFTYSNLSFDATPAGRPRDAFEAAFVDADGNPLVHPIAGNRDAFFNVTEGQPAATGTEASVIGQTVTLDLSQVTPGTTGTLIFRLVNDDGLGNSAVTLKSVAVTPGSGPGSPAAPPTAATTPATIDFTQLSDVTASVQTAYGRTSLDEQTKVLYADLSAQNAGQYPVDVPLVAVVEHLSDPSIRVRGADGLTPDGQPYYDLSGLVAGGKLAPGSGTGSQALSFDDPNGTPFTYDVLFLGQLNRPPVFTTTPGTEALVGHPYTYAAAATDPDGDPLTFSLAAGPTGMAVDPATGRVSWSPAAGDAGNQAVALRVSDGRGGTAEQDYTLAVTQPPPNRPPVFTSAPVVSADVDTAYLYQATATDPDQDALTFAVASGPQGLAIDPASGLVQWQPTASQLGLQNVTLTVSDGRGGTATQAYVVQVAQAAGNHPPVIVSSPVTTAEPGQPYTYPVKAVDPDNDPLTYSLPTSPAGMTVDPTTGLISWAPIPTVSISEFPIPTPNSRPFGIVTGPDGNLWATEYGRSKIVKMAPDGTVLTTYSTPTPDAVGINGITVGPDGNLWYVTETSGKLGKVTTSGVFTEYSIPGGENALFDITTGPDGDLWFTLYGAGKIGRITPSGVLTEFTLPPGNPLGVAPAGIVAGPDGNLWFTLFQDDKIGKITPAGVITEYPLPHPNSAPAIITVGPDGNLWFAERNATNAQPPGLGGRIGRITTSGVITEFPVPAGYSGAYGITTGPDGNLWFTQFAGYYQGDEIGRLTPNGQFSEYAVPTDQSQPLIITTGPDGNLWFTEYSSGRIGRVNMTAVQPLVPVTVRVEDGRGGSDTQSFTIDTSGGQGGIRGTVFNDVNGDGQRQLDELLITSISNSSVLRYDAVTGAFRDAFVPSGSGGLFRTHSLTFGPDGNLYVGPDAPNVLRYDGTTGAFLNSFTSGSGAHVTDLLFGPDGNLYVSSFGANALLRFDGKTGVLLNVIATGGPLNGSDDFTFGPDGNLYVVSQRDSKVLRYDAVSGTFLGTFIPSGSGGLNAPNGLAFGPDGDLYIASEFSNTVLRYDGHTGAFKSVFVAAGSGGLNTPTNLTFGPDGNLYVDSQPVSNVLRFDGTTGAFLGTFIPAGLGGLSGPDHLAFAAGTELGLGGWTVYLDTNRNGRLDPDELSTKTNADGSYSFPGLPAGIYVVAEEPPPRWAPTNPAGAARTILVGSQVVTGVDFGNLRGGDLGANHPPQFTTTPPGDPVVPQQTYRYAADATDPDGDRLTYDLVVHPDGMSVDPVTGVVTWVPTDLQEGPQTVTLRVQDGRGGSDTQSFTINVVHPGEIFGTVFNDTNGDGVQAPGRLLVASHGNITSHLPGYNSILRYDASTGAFLDALVPSDSGGLLGPHAFVFGPDGDLYVAGHNKQVLRYDGTTGAFLGPFTSGLDLANIRDLAFRPDGYLYVVDDVLNAVERFDARTGVFKGTFTSGATLGNAEEFAFGPDGNLYVTCQDAHAVFRYDGVTGKFIDDFVAPGSGGLNAPAGLLFGPDGHLYVSDSVNSEVLRYDGHTGVFEGALVPPGSGGLNDPVGLAIGPDGDLYVSSDGKNNVIRYDAVTGAFLGTFVAPGSGGLFAPYQLSFFDSTEPGLGGWTVYLDANGNGRLDPGERSTTTDANGQYAFPGVIPGTYVVAEVHQAGWVQTAPPGGTYQVTVGDNQLVSGINFGNQRSTGTTPDQPPRFYTTPPAAATAGQLLRYDAAAADPDGDPLTYDLVVHPAGMAVDPTTGTVVWVPTADEVGPQDVTLRVQDGRGGVDLQAFQVTVSRTNTAPVITSTPRGPAVVGVPYQYPAQAQDADGDPITFHLDAAPAGMTIDAATGLVAWTPTAGQVGSQHVAVTASDNHGAADTQVFDLPVVATAPDRAPSITSVPRGAVRIGDLYLYAVAATDPDGDPLTFSLPTAPAGMTIDATGLVQWTPTAAQVGSNAVQVRVDDGRGGFATQTFSVSVVAQSSNRPPSISSMPPQAATAGRPYAYDLAGTDPDGDPLSWSLDAAPAGMSIDPDRGTLRWTPTADQLGDQDVAVRVIDNRGGYATQTWTVSVRAVDVPPLITSEPPTLASVGQGYAYAVQASDADGDPLTYSLTTAPAGMTIDAAGGLIRWTPTTAQLGSRNVAVRVDDGQGGFATQTWTVVVSATPADQPPVITSTPPQTATVGQPYQYAVAATDPEGQTVLFSLRSSLAGMTIDPASGLLRWTPAANQAGPQTVSVAAIDPQGAAGTQTFTVAVADNNHPPTITSTPPQVVTAGLSYHYDVRASDPDGDPITYRLDAAPAGMAIDALGRITWAPGIPDVGTPRVAVTVSDNHGASVTQTYDLAVLADTQTPRVSLFVSANPADLGSTVTFVVSATDNVGVQALGLRINGQDVPLDGAGRASLLADTAGNFAVEARATDAAGNTGLATTTLTVIDTSDTTAPQVDLTSPADGAVIRGPVDVVGTATDANLLYYTLDATPAAGGPTTELFRGTAPVVNGVLGKFDPSGLANDAYVLTLTAVDAGGNQSSVEETVNVAGDLKLGNFTLSFTDLSVPVSGIPLTVSRTYDSLNAGQDGELGFGWRLEFRDTNLRTSLEPSGEEDLGVYTPFRDGARVYLTLPGGKREGFTFTPRVQRVFSVVAFYHPAFTADPGVTDQLSVPDYTLTQDDAGDYYDLASGLAYNPADALNFGGVYYLTTKDGTAYTIDAGTGELTSVSDAHGNTLTFSDTAVVSSAGPRVTFGRDPQGRITSVTDPQGDQVRYAYDAHGDLVSVTDRQGNVTQLVYDAPRAHYLTQVIDPLGRTGVRTAYDDQGRLIQMVDAAGKAVQLAYDPGHSTETVTDALGNPTTFEYDAVGDVVAEVDAAGGITRRTYDGNNNLLTETDPLGHTTAYTYDGDGNVLTQTDPLGKVTRNTYTTLTPGFFARIAGARPVNLLHTTTDPLGDTTTNAYDGAGNLVSTTDAAGNVTRYAYDAAGHQTSITDAAGNVTQFAYDGAGRLVSQTDALGHVTAYTYDADGNQLTQTTTLTTPAGVRTLTTTTAYDANGHPTTVTDAEGNTTRTEYDALGHQTATIDALGHRTEFRYDDRGELVQTLFADGTSTATTYDAAGHRITSTDRAGRVTTFEYDALGRLVTTIYPDATPADPTDNPRTRTEYDAAGRVTAQIDELGNRTEFVYDADGRQTVVRNALKQETTTAYDAAGRTVATTDALGHTTRFALDALGRTVQTVYADDTTTSQAYDALGRSVSATDQAGRITRYEYDALGRLTAVVDALGQRTVYGYDEAGDLATQTDANGHVTLYEYDGLGRRTATVLPLGQRSTTAYDAVGNVVSTTDFNGATVHDEYDANNRLTAQRFSDGTAVTYTYTATGQRATVTDARGVTTYAYDARDRLLSRTDPDGTEISYTYDAAGNRTSVTTPAGTTAYTFDALNRMSMVAFNPVVVGPNQVALYAYDAAGNLTQTTLPNHTSETRQYDSLNRLIYLENDSPSGVISSYRYTLDVTGNRIAVVEDTGRRVDYTYDQLSRLTREAITDAVSGNRTIDYTYDPVGNRLTMNDSAQGLTSYTYDADDRLLTETLAGQVTRYTYDANGNTLSRVASATDQAFYQWDFQNRLVGADVTDSSGTHHVVNEYDADGIRVAQTVDGQETRYLIDANRPYAEVLVEYRPGGLIVASYVYGNRLIEQNRSGVASYYQVDGLGSTRALTNGSGAITDRYVYDAFGRAIGQVGSTPNVYLFAGEQRDANGGLDYLRARYLVPQTARFLSRDRFDGSVSLPSTLNRYIYANGNPTNATDPSGYFTLTEAVTTAAIYGIVAAPAVFGIANAVFKHRSNVLAPDAVAYGFSVTLSANVSTAALLPLIPTLPFIGGSEFTSLAVQVLRAPSTSAGGTFGAEVLASARTLQVAEYDYHGGSAALLGGSAVTITAYEAIIYDLPNLESYRHKFNTLSGTLSEGNLGLVLGGFWNDSLGVNGYVVGASFTFPAGKSPISIGYSRLEYSPPTLIDTGVEAVQKYFVLAVPPAGVLLSLRAHKLI